MATVEERTQPFVPGERLSRDEFMRRWENAPNLRRAELIRGVVYMPSPVSSDHGAPHLEVATWLGVYKAATPGCCGLSGATWLMAEDSAPQPDLSLRILPEFGGQSRVEGKYAAGAPELLAEICVSTTAFDLHQKLRLYEESGVREYLAVLVEEREVRWHRLDGGRLLPVALQPVLRSTAFPGLWLNVPALFGRDLAAVLRTLDEGLKSAEHAAFVERLASQRK